MATELYGPIDSSKRSIVRGYIKTGTADIVANDVLTRDANGFVSKAGAAAALIAGVATGAASAGSNDGDTSVGMDNSEETRYRFPADAAVTRAIEGKTCDLKLAQEIDVGASVVDNVFIHAVDTENDTVEVSFKIQGSYVGVI